MFPLIESARFISIFLLVFCGFLLYYVIRSNPLGGHVSISEHSASTRKQYYIMAVGLTVAALGLGAFLTFWLAPTYDFPKWFYSVIVLIFLFILGVAWLPSGSSGSQKVSHKLHVGSVYGFILGVVILSIVTVSTTGVPAPIAHVFSYINIGIYIGLLLLYWFYPPARKKFVFYESLAVASFFALIILMTLKN